MLTHQEVCANSNTTCPPQRGMWQLRIEIISSTPKHLSILNSFIFSFVLLTPLQLVQWNCILFHSTTNLHAKYLNLHYLHGYFLVAFFNCVLAIVKSLYSNGKKKIVTNCHTKHIGIYDWIHVNLKHTKKNLQHDKKIVGISKK